MSVPSERPPFNEAEFMEDMTVGSANLEAPFNQDTVKAIIEAYGEAFHDSAIQIRCGSRANVPLVFRGLFAVPIDALGLALKHQWVREDDPLVRLNRSLDKECPDSLDEPEFFVDTGFDAVFKILGDIYTVDQILATPDMSDSIRARLQQFKDFGLMHIPAIHLSFGERTVDLFFFMQGPLSKEHLTEVVAMAGAPEPSDGVYANLVGILRKAPYYCTVCMDCETGKVNRVEYHMFFPIRLPRGMEIPEVGERLVKFWDIPSHDLEEMDILSFCFGDNVAGDIVAYRSYCGGTRSLMQSWNVAGV